MFLSMVSPHVRTVTSPSWACAGPPTVLKGNLRPIAVWPRADSDVLLQLPILPWPFQGKAHLIVALMVAAGGAQYPGEKEITFPPYTCLEADGDPRVERSHRGEVVVFPLKVSTASAAR